MHAFPITFIYFYFTCRNVSLPVRMYIMCTLCMHAWYPRNPGQNVIPSGTGITDGCDLPWGCWNMNTGHLQGHQVLLITEQHHPLITLVPIPTPVSPLSSNNSSPSNFMAQPILFKSRLNLLIKVNIVFVFIGVFLFNYDTLQFQTFYCGWNNFVFIYSWIKPLYISSTSPLLLLNFYLD